MQLQNWVTPNLLTSTISHQLQRFSFLWLNLTISLLKWPALLFSIRAVSFSTFYCHIIMTIQVLEVLMSKRLCLEACNNYSLSSLQYYSQYTPASENSMRKLPTALTIETVLLSGITALYAVPSPTPKPSSNILPIAYWRIPYKNFRVKVLKSCTIASFSYDSPWKIR